MISRRAFLGVAVASPLAAFVVGDGYAMPVAHLDAPLGAEPVEMPFDQNAAETLTDAKYGRRVFQLVRMNLSLRGRLGAVAGPPMARVGHSYGSGYFTKNIYGYIPEMAFVQNRLVADSLQMRDFARQLSDRIIAEGLSVYGRMPVFGGARAMHRYESKRLCMRFATDYDIARDTIIGRFDFLGA